MRKRYRVALAVAAMHDLREIGAYITRRDAAKASRRQLSKLRTRIRALATSRVRGRGPPELAERGLRTWREAILAPWRILYRTEGSAVYVLAVLDGRRDLSELLLRRITRP